SLKRPFTYTFQKDKPYLIPVRSAYRNPGKADAASQAEPLKNLTGILDAVSSLWQKVMETTSKIGYELEGKAYHIRDVETTKSKIFPVNARYLSAGNISNPAVTGTLNVTEEGVAVQFTTNEAE